MLILASLAIVLANYAIYALDCGRRMDHLRSMDLDYGQSCHRSSV